MKQNSSDVALVALGANLPFDGAPPQVTIALALQAFSDAGLELRRSSRLFATPCFPPGAGPDYVNGAAVVTLRHGGDADGILERLHAVERQFGRMRAQRWGMRTLDLDLLALGDSILPDAATQGAWRDLPLTEQIGRAPDRLILPHPRMQDRAFVLVPLADVAPYWVHPVLGRSVAAMLAALPQADRDAVRPLG